MDDSELLKQFARTRSQEDFSSLVSQHIDLVYSAARRQLRDATDAEDATQAVFALLAQKANKVKAPSLTAWLFATTRYVCANARRKEARRAHHERKAAEMKIETHGPEESGWREIAPLLDEAIDSLPEGDKDVVLARYFEKRSFKEVGQQFAISEEAARKRVDRATDKLKAFFARAGVVALPAGGLEAALLASAVTAAPATLAEVVAAKSLASSAAVGLGKWGTLLAATTGQKVTAAGIAAVVLIGGTTAVVVPIVNRNKQPAASAQTAATTSPATILTATTSSGVVIELLGISSLADDKWWDGTGNVLPEKPFTSHDWLREQRAVEAVGDVAAERYEVAIRALYREDGSTREPIFVQPVFDMQASQQMWESPITVATAPRSSPMLPHMRESGLARILVGFRPPVPTQMKLTLGVAAGPWKAIAESTTPSAETEHAVRPEKPKQKMVFSAVKVEDESDGPRYAVSTQPSARLQIPETFAQVTVWFPSNLWTYAVDQPQTRVVAVVDGKEMQSQHRRSGSIGAGVSGREWGETHAFPVAPERITAIRYQVRPYEPVVFENLSFKADARTTPSVNVKPAGTPMSPPPATRPVRKPRPT